MHQHNSSPEHHHAHAPAYEEASSTVHQHLGPQNPQVLHNQPSKLQSLLSLQAYLNNRIQDVTGKINNLNAELYILKGGLDGIDINRKRRKMTSDARDERQKERGESADVFKTLSPVLQSDLQNRIRQLQQGLENNLGQLIRAVNTINYSTFIAELTSKINGLAPNPETQALREILLNMKEHLDHVAESNDFECLLDRERSGLKIKISHLEELKAQLGSLNRNNPMLRNTNQELTQENQERTSRLNGDLAQRQRLGWVSLLLAGLTAAASVPLIVALTTSAITLSLSLFIGLLVAPPAVLLVVTLIIAITALVYLIKTHANQSAISKNENTMRLNHGSIGSNSLRLSELATTDIPNAEIKISAANKICTQFAESLTISKNLAHISLTAAKNIYPVAPESISTQTPASAGYNPNAIFSSASAPQMDLSTANTGTVDAHRFVNGP